MSTSRYASAGSLVLGALICFVLGIGSFVRSGHDASLAASQRTTTTQVTRTSSSRTDSSGNTRRSVRCDYQFTVDGVAYHGSDCPTQPPNESIGNRVFDAFARFQQFSATVYYDPNDPSTNSLTEFGARSGSDNQLGFLFIGAGIVMLMLVTLGVLMSNKPGSSVPAIAEAPVSPAVVPEGNSVAGQQFLEDLDHSLRSEENPNHPSTN